ncbi:MAG: hypothetical protein JSS68_06715 [Actinobacteria bacterium]|nr:hypothetical protein [Actinomycetota bacterium]
MTGDQLAEQAGDRSRVLGEGVELVDRPQHPGAPPPPPGEGGGLTLFALLREL